ncbi:hypothetical protein SEA_SKOG_47 [Gordonia phage Skog]|uniref:Uncharacterized protein n=1 Tax=Gordonia phage Skog TaxID=2704033 RepID=A0A6G6XJA5_9CAUD|nr:hypothetical protein KHQ85_gp047 [Gordonia phage Skog]QIG58199.1 hypothetical protein SEA_SKOG_47 [Gordonia phage Skog]
MTQEDIDNGVGVPEWCPIALAIRRKRGVDDAAVDDHQILVRRNQRASSYRVPQRVHDFVNAFDAGLDVEPFTFEARG